VSSFRAAAVRAAKHFGNSSGTANASTQYVIVTPTGVVPPGFKTYYCAYHDWYASTVGDVAFVALPYIPDAGTGCGAYSVNHTTGRLDGVTIVGGHEYAEALTDPIPPYGWLDSGGAENGDKCAWISSGAGAAANVTLPTGSFPVQSLWSNNANRNAGGCVIYYGSASNQH
jgi:serine protease